MKGRRRKQHTTRRSSSPSPAQEAASVVGDGLPLQALLHLARGLHRKGTEVTINSSVLWCGSCSHQWRATCSGMETVTTLAGSPSSRPVRSPGSGR